MGFLAPWFLGGLIALGVPVFVHLLRRHVSTPRPVSSLMFFERGTQSSTHHRKLRYLLLLALRFALVLLLVLAFANPFVRRTASDANSRLMIIVVDNSFSMRAGTRFVDAKQQALSALASKRHGQKAQILALGGQIEVLTQPVSDEAQLRAAAESVEPSDGHANFGELGRYIRSLSETNHSQIDLHLFSDLQRAAVPSNFADLVMPGNVKLFLHPVVQGTPPPNWTIVSVTAPAELADPKDPKQSKVEAVVAGFGTPAATKSAFLVVNGRTIATRKVEVPANGRATVNFAPLDVGYGFNRCQVRIDGRDALPEDDASVFTVRRSDPQRVLFVHDAGEVRSALYFGAALDATAHSSFVLQSVASSQAKDLDPSKFAFVVLSDTTALPSIFEHALEAYVGKGGSVLVALGTSASHHTQIPLWRGATRNPHEYLRSVARAAVGRVDFTYPAFAQTQPGRDNGGWAAVKVLYAVPVDPERARIAAQLTDGTPLLMEKQIGEGRVVLLATGLDNLTNDMPLHPVFVSFVDRMARYLSGDERLSGSRLVDSFVQLRSAAPAAGASGGVEVLGPDGKRPLSLTEAKTVRSFRLQRAGFYQIHSADGRDTVIGVNPDRRESDLQPMPQDLQELWTGSSAASASEGTSTNGDSQFRNVSLWWWVMLLALITASSEIVLASGYMGTQREEA